MNLAYNSVVSLQELYIGMVCKILYKLKIKDKIKVTQRLVRMMLTPSERERERDWYI